MLCPTRLLSPLANNFVYANSVGNNFVHVKKNNRWVSAITGAGVGEGEPRQLAVSAVAHVAGVAAGGAGVGTGGAGRARGCSCTRRSGMLVKVTLRLPC